MHLVRSFALALLVVIPAHGQLEPIPPRPASHATSPVCRVIAVAGHHRYLGSGTLVGETTVVTNWHVVTPQPGEPPVTHVEVHFPGGFASLARIECVDAEWDLAALTVARPPVAPVAIALEPPAPGEVLTLVGFGPDGVLRQQSGELVRYEAPSSSPGVREIVTCRAVARNGDSGGPIFDPRGCLAGVQFGTADGLTSGAHCGRLRQFLGRCLGWRPAPPRAQALPPAPSPELQRHDKLLAERDALERRLADAEALAPQLSAARQQLEACGKERLAIEGRLHQVATELEAAKQAPQVCLAPPSGPPAGVSAAAEASKPSALESVLSHRAATALTGALVSFGVPAGLAGVAAGGAVWLVMRRGKRRLQEKLAKRGARRASPQVAVPHAAAVDRARLEIARVPVTDHAFNRLVAALRAELAWNPEALPVVTRIWSLYDQSAASAAEKQPYREPLPPGAALGWTDPKPKE